jgi:hypothetical protein
MKPNMNITINNWSFVVAGTRGRLEVNTLSKPVLCYTRAFLPVGQLLTNTCKHTYTQLHFANTSFSCLYYRIAGKYNYHPHAYVYPSTDLAPFHGSLVGFFRSLQSNVISGFQTFRPEHHWRDINCRNAHLVHRNGYRTSFTFRCYPKIWLLASWWKNESVLGI